MRDCPVCGASISVPSVRRTKLPIFQNVVWGTVEEARAAPSASFLLATCPTCGFSYNGEFDETKIVYDAHYDNSVPSPAFRAYYESLIEMLRGRFDLENAAVYDVGCGKGEFLRMLCDAVPAVRGIGVDPSCRELEEGNLRLISDFLKPSHFDAAAKLVVIRHVLEHIAEPVAFLSMIRDCVPDEVAIFVEVPDLDWILEQNAFWDFCYEHCNYFTQGSLKIALETAGFRVLEQQRSFGDQYQWAICVPSDVTAQVPSGLGRAVDSVRQYNERELRRIEALRSRGEVAVWGMATKGVMLSLVLGSDRVIGGIDGNGAKQGKFAAGSGVRINPPGWVMELPKATPTLIMNPNYAAEIGATVRALGADIELVPV